MKANRLALTLFSLVGLVVFQLPAQQSEADRKLLEEIRTKAEKGDAQAQSQLGSAFYFGNLGVAKDAEQAVKWIRKAAEQGDVNSQGNLGYCYSAGDGVGKDLAEAVKWHRKAAEQNNANAQVRLGACFRNGQGVAKDEAEAVKWYRKAAEQGNADGQTSIGVCYQDGKGVVQDFTEAAKWYRKAAEQGSACGQNNLAILFAHGDGVIKDAPEAARWYRKAAEQGWKEAQGALGSCYANGDGVPKDYVQAYKWLNLASAQGYAKESLATVQMWMTPEQIAEAQRLSREFKPRNASGSGSSNSSNDIAHLNPSGSGTGFFISEDGFLVTNERVVRNAAQIRLVTSAGLISAKVVKVDAANDLALLKAEGRFSPLPVAASRAVKLGGTVATVGFPNIGLQGFAPKLAKGEIASLSGAGDDARYFQISVPVQPGNSGGALVDERGNVVGVVAAKLSARAALASSGALPENVNYAVKSSYLLSFLESVPDVANKLKEPESKERKFEDVVKSAEQAAVLVLVY